MEDEVFDQDIVMVMLLEALNNIFWNRKHHTYPFCSITLK